MSLLYKGTIENPDSAMCKEIKKRIRKRNGFCVNKEEKNEDTRCPCKVYRETGECDCGLYIKDYKALVDRFFGKDDGE